MSFLERTSAMVKTTWWPDAVRILDQRMAQDGGHDLAHIERVLVNAHTITQNESHPDWEVVAAAVLFHDVVNLKKDHPERHLASSHSADVAVAELKNNLDAAQLALLHEAIRSHSYSSGLVPESLEAKIVTDADRLEAIGAFGIAFYVSGMLNRSIVSMHDPFGQTRQLDDAEYGIDHFFKKLLSVRDLMYTQTGQELAQQRHDYLDGFLDQMANELGVSR